MLSCSDGSHDCDSQPAATPALCPKYFHYAASTTQSPARRVAAFLAGEDAGWKPHLADILLASYRAGNTRLKQRWASRRNFQTYREDMV